MGFVQIHKHSRIFKARTKRKPEWQDRVPIEPEQRKTYEIAARHQASFSKAFMEAVRGLLPDKPSEEFKKAWSEKNAAKVLAELPLYSDKEDSNAARRFAERIGRAYRDVIQESGEAATKRLNRELGLNLGFQIGEEVAKAKKKTELKKPSWEMVPVIPINPYSVKWIEDRGLKLIKQGVTRQQVDVLREIIQDGFSKGLRIEEAYSKIKSNIGLTNREYTAVLNRRALVESQGRAPEIVDKLTERYRERLLSKRAERIARTETIAAEAQGRQAAWRSAQDAGQLPEVERVWISAPPSGAPGRPCELCLELDGKTAPIDGSYDSSEGPIEGPPRHPSCRCSEYLRKVGD